MDHHKSHSFSNNLTCYWLGFTPRHHITSRFTHAWHNQAQFQFLTNNLEFWDGSKRHNFTYLVILSTWCSWIRAWISIWDWFEPSIWSSLTCTRVWWGAYVAPCVLVRPDIPNGVFGLFFICFIKLSFIFNNLGPSTLFNL